MGFILLEPDSIPGQFQEKCWVLALFLCISAPICSLRLLIISMLLPCWLSSEVSVMRAWTQGPVLKKSADLSFWDAFGAASSTQAVFIKMHETVPVSPANFWNTDTFWALAQAAEPVGGSGNMLVSCRTSRVRSGSMSCLWREKSRRERKKPEE